MSHPATVVWMNLKEVKKCEIQLMTPPVRWFMLSVTTDFFLNHKVTLRHYDAKLPKFHHAHFPVKMIKIFSIILHRYESFDTNLVLNAVFLHTGKSTTICNSVGYLIADVKVIYVHVLLKIVGELVSNI